MIDNDRQEVFEYLTNRDTGVITLTLNPVVGEIVSHHHVLVNTAPPAVVEEIALRFKFVSLVEGGLLIPLNRTGKEN